MAELLRKHRVRSISAAVVDYQNRLRFACLAFQGKEALTQQDFAIVSNNHRADASLHNVFPLVEVNHAAMTCRADRAIGATARSTTGAQC